MVSSHPVDEKIHGWTTTLLWARTLVLEIADARGVSTREEIVQAAHAAEGEESHVSFYDVLDSLVSAGMLSGRGSPNQLGLTAVGHDFLDAAGAHGTA